MNADGSGQTNLTNYHRNDDWSPDSQRIAWNCTFGRFLHGRVADFEICVVKADGTGLVQLTDTEGNNKFPAWSRDGRIVFTRYGCLMVMNPDGSGLAPIASCEEGGHFPDWYQPLETTASHVLIDEDRVSIRVNSNEAGRPRCALVCLLLQLHSLCLQLALQLADIGERGELLGVAVPAGVEGENVLVKHALKQPDHVIAVLQDQPVLRGIPGEDLETKLLVECPRSLEVLDSQADRKCA
jgi:hypothetical protein